MVPQLSALSLALCHEVLEGGGYQQMGTIKYAKRNFPSCSLRSQFTASQKPPLLFPNAKKNGAIKMEPSNTQKETSPLAHYVRNSLPHKSHRFCSPMRKKWSHQNGAIKYAKRNFPSCSLRSQFTASQKPPLLFPNAKKMEPYTGKQHYTWVFNKLSQSIVFIKLY